jgi:hypothetical protein
MALLFVERKNTARFARAAELAEVISFVKEPNRYDKGEQHDDDILANG